MASPITHWSKKKFVIYRSVTFESMHRVKDRPILLYLVQLEIINRNRYSLKWDLNPQPMCINQYTKSY